MNLVQLTLFHGSKCIKFKGQIEESSPYRYRNTLPYLWIKTEHNQVQGTELQQEFQIIHLCIKSKHLHGFILHILYTYCKCNIGVHRSRLSINQWNLSNKLSWLFTSSNKLLAKDHSIESLLLKHIWTQNSSLTINTVVIVFLWKCSLTKSYILLLDTFFLLSTFYSVVILTVTMLSNQKTKHILTCIV